MIFVGDCQSSGKNSITLLTVIIAVIVRDSLFLDTINIRQVHTDDIEGYKAVYQRPEGGCRLDKQVRRLTSGY